MSASDLLAQTRRTHRELLARIQRMMAIIGVMPVPPAINPTLFATPSTQWPPGFGPLINTYRRAPVHRYTSILCRFHTA